MAKILWGNGNATCDFKGKLQVLLGILKQNRKYTFFISLNNPSKISITKLDFFYYLATEY